MAFEHPVDDQVGAGERGRGVEEHRVEHGDERVVLIRVPGVVERSGLIGDVEHRRDAVLDERGPDPVQVGVRERLPVDDAPGAIIASRTPPAASVASSCFHPVGIAQREMRDRMKLSSALRPRRCAHQRFHARMLASNAAGATESVRSQSSP